MNIILFVHVILSIISVNWTVFTSDIGGFSVLTPGELQLDVKNIPIEQDTLQWNNYSYQVPDSSQQVFLYSVTHYNLLHTPTQTDSLDISNDIITETIAAIVDRLGGELLYSQAEQFDNFSARISRISYQGGLNSLKNKIILTEDKVYMIEVFSTYEAGTSFEVNKFINSFTFLE